MPRRDPWIYIGLVAFFALLFVALFGDRIAPHESIYYVIDHGDDPRPFDPGLVFPFGSDVLGRDLFSVVLAGARATLVIVVAGGIARVLAGLALSMAMASSRRLGLGFDALAALASAVPATLVALLLVKVFVRSDTNLAVFVLALLVTGWAGPYRVFRAELDRLATQAFTESARALGVRRLSVLSRHHLPHLVPLVAMSAAQQTVASLVLLAELGVLGVFVGATRTIDVSESMAKIRTGVPVQAQISELSEWGGLLANSSSRTVDSLWVTRWLFLVPGIAFAVTAVAVSLIGFALARRYARRNAFYELRTRGAATLGLGVVAFVLVSSLVPERYASARDWAAAARSDVRSIGSTAEAFASAGLRPVGATFAVERDTTHITKTGPATVRVGAATVSEQTESAKNVRPLLDGATGGGVVDGPLVYASRGLSPADYQPQQTSLFGAPDLGTVINHYADDYAGINVRGKIVLLVRFAGVLYGRSMAVGPDPETAMSNAIKRGAAAVLFVDANLPLYTNVATAPTTRVNPYTRLEDSFPITEPVGTPVVILSTAAANRLLSGTGIQLTDRSGVLSSDAAETKTSAARDLGVIAHIEVPVARQSAHVSSIVGEVADLDPATPRMVVWCVRHADAGNACSDVASALAREVSGRRVPFVFVDFDPSIDPNANALAVAEILRSRRIGLMVVIDGLDGSALKFTTPFGDLVAAFDLYADRAGARYMTTRGTLKIDFWEWPGSRAYAETRAVLVQPTGPSGDLRPDAAALLGYVAGRYAAGAEELVR